LISIFLDSPEAVLQIQKKLIERKIITNFFLFEDTALRITPPLCIKIKELKYFTSNLIEVLNEL
ncbi:aspartate aminotransferase family protein, partial [Schleiferiaceae bacterium]|nr:aspartate aminotransferase family protein [Schleiferiaceae bacterium]